jgi:hypothetical protein
MKAARKIKKHKNSNPWSSLVKEIEKLGIPYQNSITIYNGNMMDLIEQNSLIGLA